MSIPYPFPYQGSKRKLAPAILALLPDRIDRLVEPFAGAAAVSIAAAYRHQAQHFLLNDINAPLMQLWDWIISRPDDLIERYRYLWTVQQGQERKTYFWARDEFNRTRQPEYLLFLLVRCVKASVRYNTQGGFNQGPDNRRKGTHPDRLGAQIRGVSRLLKGKTTLHAGDYREVVLHACPTDVIYLDPPYQGVCGSRDPRYLESLAFDAFVDTLHELNRRSIRYLISYDGRTGTKTHGRRLPESLDLHHLEINAGRSSQATLLGTSQITYESLYLSPALAALVEALAGGSKNPARQLGLPL